jgi:putative ABC transport system substrate-binding protein
MLVPGMTTVTILVNPTDPTLTEVTLRDLKPAARAMGVQTRVLDASSSGEINAIFAGFVKERPDALLVALDPFFNGRRIQLVQSAARYAIPASFVTRDFTEAGGLMSYGTNIADAWRQVGVYTGRVLKGDKLPISPSCNQPSSSLSSTLRLQGCWA